MLRAVFAALWTIFLAARIMILSALGIGTVICLFYSIYWLLKRGELPDTSLSSLYLSVYEHLLPPRYFIFNTIFIFCVRIPLVVLFGLLFSVALVLDKLGQALLRWLEVILRTDKES